MPEIFESDGKTFRNVKSIPDKNQSLEDKNKVVADGFICMTNPRLRHLKPKDISFG